MNERKKQDRELIHYLDRGSAEAILLEIPVLK